MKWKEKCLLLWFCGAVFNVYMCLSCVCVCMYVFVFIVNSSIYITRSKYKIYEKVSFSFLLPEERALSEGFRLIFLLFFPLEFKSLNISNRLSFVPSNQYVCHIYFFCFVLSSCLSEKLPSPHLFSFWNFDHLILCLRFSLSIILISRYLVLICFVFFFLECQSDSDLVNCDGKISNC